MLIDKLTPDAIETLYSRASNVHQRHYLHLLIDGAFVDGVHTAFIKEEKQMLFDSLPSCSEKTRNVSPFAVTFDPTDYRHRVLLERCSGWPMLSAIETPENLIELSNRLAAWCIVEADGDRFNLRFADTRRLPAIFATLTPEQRVRFVGPAVNWSFQSREGAWKDLDLEVQNLPPDLLEFIPSLEKPQFTALLDDSRADEILALMNYRGETPSCSYSRRWKSMVTALKLAGSAGMNDADTVEWAVWCVKVHHSDDESLLKDKLQIWLKGQRVFEG
jgi:hypothetical protein